MVKSVHRNRLLLFCLYAGAYAYLRYHGEVVVQTFSLATSQGPRMHSAVSPHPHLPFWRQQLWRALFSLPMVVEEEGNRAVARGQQMGRSVQKYVTGRSDAQQPAPAAAPAGAIPANPTATRGVYSAGPGLAPGEKMLHVAPPGEGAAVRTGGRNAPVPEEGYPRLAPGEKLLYVAPPGEAPDRSAGAVRR